MVLSIQTLCSVFSRSTLLIQYSHESFWDRCNKLFTSGFGYPLPFLSSSVRLDGKHWWTAIFRSLQRCSVWVYVRAGPFKNSHGVVVKPLLCYFSGVLGAIVFLEGEPSAQSEIQSTLEKVFVQDIPLFGCIHLSLDCNQSPCLCS